MIFITKNDTLKVDIIFYGCMNTIHLEQIIEKSQREELLSSLCDGKILDISIRYISDFSSAKNLRDFIDSACKKYGVSAQWRTRLVLVIDELNNNAIEYGSRKGDMNTLRFVIRKQNTNSMDIEAYVIDTWKGLKSKTAQEMKEIQKKYQGEDFSKHESIRGRGLFLITSHLVDSLYFKNNIWGGLIVGIKKRLSTTL